jgi:hypothetical protein
MALKKRERNLALATAALLAVFAAVWMFSGGGEGPSLSIADLRKQRDLKLADLAKKQAASAGLQANRAKLAGWEKQALPAQADAAQSSYQTWLRALVGRQNFRTPKIDATGADTRRGVCTVLRFTLQARATLDQLTRFLYDFYAAGHLHQVRRLTVAPAENSKDLFDVTLGIEALSLPSADRKDKLSTERSQRLGKPDVKEYLQTVVRRRMEGERFVDGLGVFTPYSPPPPPPVVRRDPPPRPPTPPPRDPPKPPAFDHTKYTVVTAINVVDGTPEVWLRVQTTGQQFVLHEGGKFQVGEVRGSVGRIKRHEVEIELNGQRRLVPNGGNLRDGVAIQ